MTNYDRNKRKKRKSINRTIKWVNTSTKVVYGNQQPKCQIKARVSDGIFGHFLRFLSFFLGLKHHILNQLSFEMQTLYQQTVFNIRQSQTSSVRSTISMTGDLMSDYVIGCYVMVKIMKNCPIGGRFSEKGLNLRTIKIPRNYPLVIST